MTRVAKRVQTIRKKTTEFEGFSELFPTKKIRGLANFVK
jgi:hypothetical protein